MDKLTFEEELPSGVKIWRVGRCTTRPGKRDGDFIAELTAPSSDLTIRPKVEEVLQQVVTLVVAQKIYDDPIGRGIDGYIGEALNCESIERGLDVVALYLHEHEAWKLERALEKSRGH